MPSSSEKRYRKLRRSWRRDRFLGALGLRRSTRVLVECGEFRFMVDRRDKIVGRSLRRIGTYEPEEFARFAELVTPDCDVLCVGAHIGALAIPAARLCRRIAMIEANPDSFELLSENCALNGVENCDLHHFAAGESDDRISFVMNTHNSGGSKRKPRVSDDLYFYDEPDVVEVPMRVLDQVFPDRNFDLVVMDIEGSEYFALQGMTRILAGASCLIIEFVPHHLSNVAGISVGQFLEPILPNFTAMTVPSTGRTAAGSEIPDLLQAMFDAGQADSGLIFEKT